MGYSTDFEGALFFKKEPTTSELVKLNNYLDEDCRDHPEWGHTHLTYIDLELNDEMSGLVWNGSEKTYDLVDKVNLIIDEMQKDFPDFELEGEMLAQGEEITDRWILCIENGRAVRRDVVTKGEIIKCPHCGEHFILEELQKSAGII